MIWALLMTAAVPDAAAEPPEPTSAVEAERAFAARAQEAGQWRAFAEFADDSATMFVPQPVKAKEWLPRQREERQAVEWAPAESFVSCDGDTAVNTGPWWLAAAGREGFFTTVWRNGDAGWRWVYDGGGPLASPRTRVAEPRVERASCDEAPIDMAPLVRPGVKTGGGSSRDRSLLWSWSVDQRGARHFKALLWTGEEYRTVIEDVVLPK